MKMLKLLLIIIVSFGLGIAVPRGFSNKAAVKPEGDGGQPNSRSHKPEGDGAASNSRSHSRVLPLASPQNYRAISPILS